MANVSQVGRDGRWRARRRVVATLAVGLAALIVGVVGTLAASSERRVGNNGVEPRAFVGPLIGSGEICQDGEWLPAGTGALRVALQTRSDVPPAVSLTVGDGSTTFARSRGSARWEADALVVPLRPVIRSDTLAEVCVALGDPSGSAATMLAGAQSESDAAARFGGKPLAIRLQVEYLRPSAQSWLSFAPTVAERIGLGHAWPAALIAWLACLSILAGLGLASWQLARTAE